jgi:hypothetical protein
MDLAFSLAFDLVCTMLRDELNIFACMLGRGSEDNHNSMSWSMDNGSFSGKNET